MALHVGAFKRYIEGRILFSRRVPTFNLFRDRLRCPFQHGVSFFSLTHDGFQFTQRDQGIRG